MDLSILEGDDPTGEKAEAFQKKIALETPSLQYSEKAPVGDTNQFHVYRRIQRRQAERQEFINEQKTKLADKVDFERRLQERVAEINRKTEKRRLKRLRIKDRSKFSES